MVFRAGSSILFAGSTLGDRDPLLPAVPPVLLQLQSELPVCTPAIVHVLLHRLAALRPGKEVSPRVLEEFLKYTR